MGLRREPPPPAPDDAWRELGKACAAWGLDLSEGKVSQLKRYLADLLDYNRKVNLTAETDPAAIIFRHIADGLAAVMPLKARLDPAPEILDLGSGGGFIGVSVKIAWPEAQVTLMEPLERKFRFLSGTAARSGLKGLRVLRMTAEEAARRSLRFDAVLERALAEFPKAKSLASPLVKPGGLFAAFLSKRGAAGLDEEIPYRLPREASDRFLAICRAGA